MNSAARALESGDFDSALSALLVAWNETRAPELAALIDEVSASVTAQLPKLDGKKQGPALAAWVELARAKRPGDVGRMMVGLIEVLASGPMRFPLPRLDELLTMPPDPRIARALLDAIAGPIGGWSDKAYVRTIKALLRHGDARLLIPLEEALSKRSRDYIDAADLARFERVAAAWKKRVALPASPGLERVRAALKTAPAAQAPKKQALDSEVLLAAIYADPTDDACRLVYADDLSSRGDARGEFIVLQIDRAQGRSSAAKQKREDALLKANRSAWLSTLATQLVMSATQWERGFPVSTSTKLSRLYQAEVSFIRPEWATFERIHFDGAALITESMRGLKEAFGVTESAMQRIAHVPAHLHRLEVLLEDKHFGAEDPSIAAALAIPSLRALVLRSTDWQTPRKDALLAFFAAVSSRLDSLIVTGPNGGDGASFETIIDRPDLVGGLTTIGWGFHARAEVIARRTATTAPWSTLEICCDITSLLGEGIELLKRMLDGVRDQRFEVATLTQRANGAVELLARRVARRVVLAAG